MSTEFDKIISSPEFKIFELLKGHEIPESLIKMDKWNELERLQENPEFMIHLTARYNNKNNTKKRYKKLAELDGMDVKTFLSLQKEIDVAGFRTLFKELVKNREVGKYTLEPVSMCKCDVKCIICKQRLSTGHYLLSGPIGKIKIEGPHIHYLIEHDVLLSKPKTHVKLPIEKFKKV